jgi:hypothetical protein
MESTMATIEDEKSIRGGRDSRARTAMTIRIEAAMTLALTLACAAFASGSAVAAGADLCGIASPAVVGKALHATIVRAEPPEGADAGCEYSAKGTPVNSATNHAIAMANGMGAAPLDPQSTKIVSGFFNGVLQFLYTQCNCASQDVIPLAKRIVASL